MRLLTGACILVTRPPRQSAVLLKKLRDAGARTLYCPVIAIRDCYQTPANAAKIAHLSDYQAVVFISQNAVEYGLRLLRENGMVNAELPLIAAIGRSTAAALKQEHIHVSACPVSPDSAALADTSALRKLDAGSRVLIFRGKGGKETLARIFSARGISTDYAEVYERIKPPGRAVNLVLPDGRKIDLIMLTSRDSLQNLYAMTPSCDRGILLDMRLLIGSPAMLDLVDKLRFRRPPIVAASPLDDDMFVQAVAWWRRTQLRPAGPM